mgnify:CR=1 FL=1
MENKKEKTKIDIILPNYNSSKFVIKTISSIFKQTYKNWKLIIVDDFSDTETKNILKKISKKKKIKVFFLNKNRGAGFCRNFAIKKSKSPYLAFIDSDDFWLPDKLDKQTKFMEENNFDFTFCNYEKIISTKKKIKVKSSKPTLSYIDLLKSNEIGLSTVQLSKTIILDELFPPLKTKEDYVAWLKITKNNTYAHNFPYNLVKWNKTNGSLSSDYFQKISDGLRVFREYEKFNFLKSLYYLFILSINSIKRKI